MRVTLKRENLWSVALVCAVAVALFFVFNPKKSLESRLFSSAQKLEEKKEYALAVDEFERVTAYAPDSRLALESAKRAGVICLYQLKDFKKAIFFFRHIVRHSQNQNDAMQAQKQIAEIFYEKLSDYSQAVLEYNRLLEANPPQKEEEDIRARIARSYFYAGNFDQTVLEVDDFEKWLPDSSKIFEMWMLKAGALTGLKRHSDAIVVYDRILSKFNDRPDLDEVFINKAQAFEELKDWDKAIAVLKGADGRVAHSDVMVIKLKNLIQRKEKKKQR